MPSPSEKWARWSARWGLDRTQRRTLVVLVGLLLAYVAVRLVLNPATIDNPQPAQGERAAELADRLDPNNAEVAELAALPGIGQKRAEAIVTRRELVHKRHADAVAFSSPDDLYVVPGFGRAMVEQIKPYLVFPTTQKTADTGRTSP